MHLTPRSTDDEALAAPLWPRLALAALLIAGVAVFIAAGGPHYLSLETIKEHRSALLEFTHQHYAPALILIGAAIGTSLLFLAVRHLFADAVRRRLGPKAARVSAGFAKNAFGWMLFLRLTPMVPYWLVNLVPAITSIRIGTYALATVLGIVPITLVVTSLGDAAPAGAARRPGAGAGRLATGTCQQTLIGKRSFRRPRSRRRSTAPTAPWRSPPAPHLGARCHS